MLIAKGFIFVIVYISIEVDCSVTPNEDTIDWDTIKPGDLLYSLDTFISGQKQPSNFNNNNSQMSKEKSNGQTVPNRSAERNIPLQRRADDVSPEVQPYDYDTAYESFVQKYFGDSTKANSDNTSTENYDKDSNDSGVENLSAEESEEGGDEIPLTEESKFYNKAERCKNVIKNHSNCRICTNKNGETSENCSYNRQSAPKSFAIKIENKYRKQRKLLPSESVENSFEKTSRSDDSAVPTCTQKRSRESVCYHCETSVGENTIHCYSDTTQHKTDSMKEENKENTHKRIYKRTVMYTYENVTRPPLSTPSSSIDDKHDLLA